MKQAKYHGLVIVCESPSPTIGIFTVKDNGFYKADWKDGKGSTGGWTESEITARLKAGAWRHITKLEQYLEGLEHETET
jgi:hypothetical protein